MNIKIELCSQPIDIQECIEWAQAENCGAIDVFIGTVRNNTKGRDVLFLEFEAYPKMAILEMEKIAKSAIAQFEIEKILIYHAVGTLNIGAIPVVIVVAAKHRAAAFDACRFAIDTLKQTVPIWKKEVYKDGEIWVSAHP